MLPEILLLLQQWGSRMQSTADADVPSFFQLHGLLSAWPAEYQKLAQDQLDLATQLQMLSTTPCPGELKRHEQVPVNPQHILPNLLFLGGSVHVVQVWSSKCHACNQTFPFDGNGLGIVNLDNHVLFSCTWAKKI